MFSYVSAMIIIKAIDTFINVKLMFFLSDNLPKTRVGNEMSHANWKTIRSNVNELAPEGLVGLVKELYNLNAQNQTFLEARFGNQQNGLEEYKRIIEANICPHEPWKRDASLSTGRQAIRDYKKARGDPEGLIDLMIFYCECGVSFTNQFGDIGERFYDSMESMYEDTLKLLKKHSYCQELFLTRLQRIGTYAS